MSEVKKYRKKPVIIEAMQFTGGNGAQLALFVGEADIDEYGNFRINTLEGRMSAIPGDYIIKGVHGEFYPCKPDIFTKTYEAA